MSRHYVYLAKLIWNPQYIWFYGANTMHSHKSDRDWRLSLGLVVHGFAVEYIEVVQILIKWE